MRVAWLSGIRIKALELFSASERDRIVAVRTGEGERKEEREREGEKMGQEESEKGREREGRNCETEGN